MHHLLTYLKGDRVIWIITLLMLAFSMVSVFSYIDILVKTQGGSPLKYLFKHAVYICISGFAMYWVHLKDPKNFSKFSKVAYYLAIALLIFTMLFGIKVNDAGRWVRIPIVGLTFQSSDFAKLAMILYVSRLLVEKKNQLNNWKEGFIPVILPVVIISALIIKDNFSTAIIVSGVGFALLFVGRVPISKLLLTISAAITVLFLLVLTHKALPGINILPRYETWENRILNKFDDNSDVIANAQAMNAKLAIYNGRLTTRNFGIVGQGIGDGKLKGFLPEAYADFYYASFVEEMGPIWAIILVLLYLILLYRIIRIGLNADRLIETYTCIGIGILILSQASINMLVCTGIAPVTGQNMPLLAMGGSALVVTTVAIGIVQAIAHQQNLRKSNSVKKTDNA